MLVPVPADPAIGRGGVDGDGDAAVETAADRVIEQIATWCGIPDLADRIVVRRTIAPGDFAADLHAWRGNALGLAHTLGQSAMFRPRNASRKVRRARRTPGGSALPGIGLPMCLISAELVLKRLRGDRTAGPAARAGQGVTCRGSTCWRSSSSAGGVAALDARWRLAAWSAPGRTAAAVGIGTAFFLSGTPSASRPGVFVKGDSPLLLGIDLAPQLPLEEPFFLAFLCYLALVAWAAALRVLGRRAARGCRATRRRRERRHDLRR